MLYKRENVHVFALGKLTNDTPRQTCASRNRCGSYFGHGNIDKCKQKHAERREKESMSRRWRIMHCIVA